MYQARPAPNPGGTGHYRPFRDKLLAVLRSNDWRRMSAIVEKLVRAAERGEPWAIQTVIERTDGKAPQAIEITSNSVTNNVIVSLKAEELAEILQLLSDGGVRPGDGASPVAPVIEHDGNNGNGINGLEDDQLRQSD